MAKNVSVRHVINILSFSTNMEFEIQLKAALVLGNIDFVEYFGVEFSYLKLKEQNMLQN